MCYKSDFNGTRGDGFWLDVDTEKYDKSNPKYTTSNYVMMGVGIFIAVLFVCLITFGFIKYS